ncbi:hypothetical protein HRbin15_02476 [bacterium HR15]|nr:hypothetical protein HRbin15_02476 [bacterium HR15]
MCGKWAIRVSLLVVWLLIAAALLAQSRSNTLNSQIVDAFNKTVGVYFQLLSKKDPLLTDHFTRIASDNFRCEWRDEETKDKKQWLDYLQRYLGEVTMQLRYEYEITAIKAATLNRVVVRLSAVEIRLWKDESGLFGPAGCTLEFREPLDVDVVLVYEKGEWKWEQFNLYGMGKRAFEQDAKH